MDKYTSYRGYDVLAVIADLKEAQQEVNKLTEQVSAKKDEVNLKSSWLEEITLGVINKVTTEAHEELTNAYSGLVRSNRIMLLAVLDDLLDRLKIVSVATAKALENIRGEE